MKNTIALCSMALLSVCLPAHCQVTLNAGETYTYQFSTLPRTGFTFFGAPSGLLALGVNGPSLQPGDSLRFEMFDDVPSGDPFFSRTVTASSDPSEFFASVSFVWQDLQGSIRLTMVSGSATIDSFSLLVLRVAGPSGLNQYSASVVPEPRPALRLVPSPTALAIRWPASETNFVLEATSGLAPGSQWQTVTNPVETVDGMFSVAVDFEMQARFFRLRKPLP
jgi:hypothetical protein